MSKDLFKYGGKKTRPPQEVDVEYNIYSAPPGPAGSTGQKGESAYEIAVRNGFVGTESQWLASLVGPQGPSGTDGSGQGVRPSTVFRFYLPTEEAPLPPTPTGGTYNNPVPPGWHDTIPAIEQGKALFMSVRNFTSDGRPPQDSSWSTPMYAGDTEFIDIEYTLVKDDPGTPATSPANWENGPLEGAWWMAIRNKQHGLWGPWTVTKIKAEDGAQGPPGPQGPPGTPSETRYAVEGSFTVPPDLVKTDRYPIGWSVNPPNPADVTTGMYVWQTTALIDLSDDSLFSDWTTPVRVTGIQGSPGTSRSTITSTVFRYWVATEANPKPPKPTTGDYDNPVPTDWYDGIPPLSEGSLFMTSRIFTSDGAYPQQAEWETVTYAGDTELIDIDWSDVETDPGNPIDNPSNWQESAFEGAIWMAIRTKTLGIWGPWTVTRIAGEKGEKGDPGAGINMLGDVSTVYDLPSSGMNIGDAYVVLADGRLYYYTSSGWESVPFVGPEGPDGPKGNAGDKVEMRWATSKSRSTPPAINVYETIPYGWTTSLPILASDDILWFTTTLKTGTGTMVGVWSQPQPVSGPEGKGFEIQYANVGPSENVNTLPSHRWTSTVPVLASNESLWVRMRNVTSGVPGSWSTPVKMSGRDGSDVYGPSMAYRGDWSSLKQYKGSSMVVDVVKYIVNGKGYIAKPNAGTIPVGTLPTNTSYWNEFTENIDSVFTDFLFAYSGYISNLTVGQIQTATEMERTTIGYKPSPSTSDPSRNWSKHGIRQYWPNGNLMSYMGYVPTFSSGAITVNDSWATLVWKQDGTIFFKLDSESSSGPVYNTVVNATWSPIKRGPHFSSQSKTATKNDLEVYYGRDSDAVFGQRFCGSWQSLTNSGNIGLTGISNEYFMRIPPSSEPDQRVKYVTTFNSTTAIPDGWYGGLDSGIDVVQGETSNRVYITFTAYYVENGYIVNSHVIELPSMRLEDGIFTGTCPVYIDIHPVGY